ncbi:MAG: bifunctional folylpolyglutamate synthase/dihydrofolate synthase, partial [Oscillospiraceae bacterium]|nr:bifunctional folylpolyglutamate synthase/dihydrofolate synthase [Oscillospiraceae bacterium]
MTAAELRRFFAAARSRGSRPGLSRIAGLLARCGDPQKTLRFVHVAGTNGKGSTAAMLSSILTAAGLRTGRFTSPCVFDFFEQIAVDGAPVPRRTLSAAAETLSAAAASMDDPPTEFELLTAAALLCFAREGCDLAVLEAGLGGAEDATNVIPAPEVAVFTRVGLDHTALLGDSVEQIARAKSGILKPGCSAVCWPGGAAEAVFARAAAEKGVPLTAADFSSLVSRRADLSGQRFDL